jgi:dTDP-glucose 4,6-dehydratase
MARILITGGAGFIGSNLVRLMIHSGHDVLNVDKLTYAGNLQSLTDLNSNPRYRFAQVDIADGASIHETLLDYCPDAVMHLAAESHVDRSIDGPKEFIDTNVCGTLNILQAALSHWRSLDSDLASQFRFLHVSTDEVYGSLGAEGLFTEETRYDPHSPYSASKAASDHLARAWFDTYGLPVIVTNCSNNYGPYQFPEKLVPVVILKCLRGEPIPVYGKGENIRDWLFVGDHCEALATVLKGGRPGQTYNIGGNNEQRNIDLVSTICGLMDEMQPRADGAPYASQITFVADRPGHDLRYAIDAGKIRRELGWQPKQDHGSGFRQTVKWYLDNRTWWESILSGNYRLQRLGTA